MWNSEAIGDRRPGAVRFLLCLLPLVALALPLAATGEEPEAEDAVVKTAVDDDLDLLVDGEALSDEELGSQRAREDVGVQHITINDQDQGGDVTDNVAMGNTNGDNVISGESFTNSSGFFSTVQNTGNNVLIQSSTIINVTVDAPTN